MFNSTSIPETHKFCKKCNTSKPFQEFGKDRTKKDGLSTVCLECRRKYDKAREQTPERQQWREDYFTEHPELPNQWHRAWRSENIEHARQWARDQYAKNPQVSLDGGRKWRAENPEKKKAEDIRERSARAVLPTEFTGDDWQFAIDYFCGSCAYCGKVPEAPLILSPDHWVTKTEGGLSLVDNIVPSCYAPKGARGGCNNLKHNADPHTWLLKRFGEVEAKAIEMRVTEYFAVARRRKYGD